MFTIQDLLNVTIHDSTIQTICQDVHTKWIELDLPDSSIQKCKDAISQDVLAYIVTKLESERNAREHQLKEMRVLKVRAEIEEWWTKCRISEDERRTFEPYLSRDFTDELLTLHQNQLKLLQCYHADNLHLFEVIDHYMELYDRYLELEAYAKNPNRLFENRGGQLLKDERDRKAARKDLPKLEKKIALLIADYEHKYTRPFTMNGISFNEFFKLHTQKFKENRPVESLKVSTTTTTTTTTSEVKVARLGSGLKRKNVKSQTPHSTSKVPKLQAVSSKKSLYQVYSANK